MSICLSLCSFIPPLIPLNTLTILKKKPSKAHQFLSLHHHNLITPPLHHLPLQFRSTLLPTKDDLHRNTIPRITTRRRKRRHDAAKDFPPNKRILNQTRHRILILHDKELRLSLPPHKPRINDIKLRPLTTTPHPSPPAVPHSTARPRTNPPGDAAASRRAPARRPPRKCPSSPEGAP